MMKVEDNIKAPERAVRTKYPFAEMQRGSSFAIPVVTRWDGEKTRERVLASAYAFSKKQPQKMSFASDIRNEAEGLVLRVWRMK